MTLTALQLGGGYIYQWQCAALLALDYLVDYQKFGVNAELNELIDGFLGQVHTIQLEGAQQENEVEIEDIGLVNEDRSILIQVKAKEAEGRWWVPSDPQLLKALYSFYQNPALDDDNPSVRFVFLSNRGFNPHLTKIKKAIEQKSVQGNSSVEHLFKQLKRKYDETLKLERFEQLMRHLALVQFLSTDTVKQNLKNKFLALHIENPDKAYATFYSEFSEKSIRGSRISLDDLYRIIPDLFTGKLVDYVSVEPQRSIAYKIQKLTAKAHVPNLWNPPDSLSQKIEDLLQKQREALNAIEAFVLIIALSVRYLALISGRGSSELDFSVTADNLSESSKESIHDLHTLNTEQFISIIRGLQSEGYLSSSEFTKITELSSEIILIANALDDFGVDEPQYNAISIRKEQVRLRLLGILVDLGKKIALDHYIDPLSPPIPWGQMTSEEQNSWWRQAYVHSVNIEAQRLQICFGIPNGYKDQYQSVLIEPLVQNLTRSINLYDSILKAAGINLKMASPKIVNRNVQPIPDENWRNFKQAVETEIARRDRDHLHQDIVRKKRLRRLLVSAEVSLAENMTLENRHLQAAQTYKRAAEILVQGKETSQARFYAQKSAKIYLLAECHGRAAAQYLRSAEIWLNNTVSPGLARRELDEAQQLIESINNSSLHVRFLLTQARLAFTNLQDDDAAHFLDQATELIPQVSDEEHRINLKYTLTETKALYALVWEEWKLSRTILLEQIDSFVGFPQQQLQIIHMLLIVSAELGKWKTADRLYRQGLCLINSSTVSMADNILKMHYAASLARRGSLEKSYKLYSTALEGLEDEVDNYTLWLIYRNMQYMLIQNGALHFKEFWKSDRKRLDLFRITQTENLGYDHRRRSAVALSKRKHRKALQHIRLALMYYWREGDWAGIESAYEVLALLRFETGQLFDALSASLRANDSKKATQYATELRDTSNTALLSKTIMELLKDCPAACEQKIATEALGILADVVPPTFFDKVFERLLRLVQGPENNEQDRKVRKNAAVSLSSITPWLRKTHKDRLVTEILNQLQRKQRWTTTKKLVELLGNIFVAPNYRAKSTLYETSLESLIGFKDNDAIKDKVELAMVQLAINAPDHIRSHVVDYLSKYSTETFRLRSLAFLGEPIPDDQLISTIKRILKSINIEPQRSGNRTIIQMNFSNPRSINAFNHLLPQSMYDYVIDGLLEAVINDYNDFRTRSGAVWALSELPTNVMTGRVDEITDYLLWGAEGSLPLASHIEWQIDSQINPFSTLRMNTGNVEQVRRSSLRALGKLYSHVSTNLKKAIQDQFISCSRDENPIVRQGVAMALDIIESEKELSSRILLALIVLLHDSDSRPRSWACRAAGHLLVNELADPFVEDFIDRVIDLAKSEKTVEVRIGLAIALRCLTETRNLDDIGANISERISDTLTQLSNDVSYRVRREATRERPLYG